MFRIKKQKLQRPSQDPSFCQGQSSEGGGSISEAGEPPAPSLVGEIRHSEVLCGKYFMLGAAGAWIVTHATGSSCALQA